MVTKLEAHLSFIPCRDGPALPFFLVEELSMLSVVIRDGFYTVSRWTSCHPYRFPPGPLLSA